MSKPDELAWIITHCYKALGYFEVWLDGPTRAVVARERNPQRRAAPPRLKSRDMNRA
jgi:hypothetical protein